MSTTNNGEIQPGAGVVYRTARRSGVGGSFAIPAGGGGVLNNIYKNQGWYAAGGVFEVWLSSPTPTSIPPSGHTLTDIQYQLLEV